MDYYRASLALHKKHQGKIEIKSKVPLRSRNDLSLAYTPGVAQPCREIARDPNTAYQYTIKANSVAVVTDGSSVLGLGNIGAIAGLPVMEGKALLFKELGGVDAWPICLATQNPDEIVKAVEMIAPGFGGINLEDIAAPQCFEIEERLQNLGIPVMHDDQHGTAVVVLAGLLNACQITQKNLKDLRVVVNGAGAAGIAITKLLSGDEKSVRVKDILLVDSVGIISRHRTDLNPVKQKMLSQTNASNQKGSLADALKGADVFIGVSRPKLLTSALVQTMNKDPIIFALANPEPEILPKEAHRGGAAIVATGRSDYANQVNNALAFPGIFRGALDARAKRITTAMKVAAAKAIAGHVKKPTAQNILPPALDRKLGKVVAKAVAKAADQSG